MGFLAPRRQPVIPAVVAAPPPRPSGVMTTPAAINGRAMVEVHTRAPYDPPPRPSARPASITKVLFRHFAKPWEDRFVIATVGPAPRAAVARGQMNPHSQRANITRPPAVVYGSLFTYESEPYY